MLICNHFLRGIFMRLLRVQIPEFRVLKNVDIVFEKEFHPSIFPLGSQNGGGKSTLLQLIFVLLHCSGSVKRHQYLQNILAHIKIFQDQQHPLATFEIWHNDQLFNIQFLVCNDEFLKKGFDTERKGYFKFSALSTLEQNKEHVNKLKEDVIYFKNSYEEMLKKTSEDEDFDEKMTSLMYNVYRIDRNLFDSFNLYDYTTRHREEKRTAEESKQLFEKFQQIFPDLIEQIEKQLKQDEEQYRMSELIVEEIHHYLQQEKLLHITNFSTREDPDKTKALLCHIDDLDTTAIQSLLNNISQKIFLTTPSTQVCLFLPKEARMLLFKKELPEHGYSSVQTYSQHLMNAETDLPGFFTYEFIAIDSILESFKVAMNKDFRKVIKTGQYGNNYTILLSQLNSILKDKKLSPDIELSEIMFEARREEENISLSPEDLSHGELRRLSIYAWLKSKQIEDAVVLFDEIEIAFHPDWAYQIVGDLEQWEPNNQYILATHSYELCQALTPAHVKELEPKLLKRKAE